MRIALLIERFDPGGGGLEQWAAALARALLTRGHQVTVLAFRGARVPVMPGLRVEWLPWHPSRLARARTVEAAAASGPFDVTHDLGIAVNADLLHPQSGSRLANERRERATRGRLGRCLAALDPKRRHWLAELREFERRRYRPDSPSRIVAVSRLVAHDLHWWHGVAGERMSLIPNGIDTARFTPLDPARRAQRRRQAGWDGQIHFLFAAHNPGLKGLPTLLRAFGQVAHTRSDVRLTVLGCEPDRAIHRAVRRSGLHEIVRFPGRVGDPLAAFQMADAFVLPTWHDACSLTVLEACGCGVPVITTRANGAAERLSDGVEGRILADAGDVAALTRALAELCDPFARARMAAAAATAGARNGFDQNVEALERLYHEVGRNRAGRA